MHKPDGRTCNRLLNGEIYNFRDRRNLEGPRHAVFETVSPTLKVCWRFRNVDLVPDAFLTLTGCSRLGDLRPHNAPPLTIARDTVWREAASILCKQG